MAAETEPTLTFEEVTLAGVNKWKLLSIDAPQWELKNGTVGDVYEVGCHLFVLVHSDSGEVLSHQCTLPEPQT